MELLFEILHIYLLKPVTSNCQIKFDSVKNDEVIDFFHLYCVGWDVKPYSLTPVNGRAVNFEKLAQHVLRFVCSVGQALVYHLSDVKGMSLWPDKFSAVGLSQTATHEAARVAGSFMLKARELQQLVFRFFSAGLHRTQWWKASLIVPLNKLIGCNGS